MNLQDNRRGGDMGGGLALIDAASSLLAKRKSDVPQGFIGKLFALATPEDVQHCDAEELASIAERSWSFLAERRPGTPKIRFEPLSGRRGISALEIVNDDMPFLVDSVVGELNSRGLEIRLFVHPVFLVERDAAAAPGVKASSTSTLREWMVQASVPSSCMRSRPSSPRFAAAYKTGSPCSLGCATSSPR